MNELIQAAFTSLDGQGAPFTFWIAGVGAVLVAVAFAGFVGNWLAKRFNAFVGDKDAGPFVARRDRYTP